MIDTTSEDDVGEEAAADCAETVCVCIQYFANWRVKIAHIDTRSDPKPPKISRVRASLAREGPPRPSRTGPRKSPRRLCLYALHWFGFFRFILFLAADRVGCM